MRLRKAIGTAVLWLVAVPLFVLILLGMLNQQHDEVDANSTTSGTVTKHVTNPNGPTYVCWFRYAVAGTEYRSADNCSHDDTPIGSTVTVNYAADAPGVGFIHGDVTWWDKLATFAISSGVVAGICLATFLFVRYSERRRGPTPRPTDRTG